VVQISVNTNKFNAYLGIFPIHLYGNIYFTQFRLLREMSIVVTIAVGSKNPVKINATLKAFRLWLTTSSSSSTSSFKDKKTSYDIRVVSVSANSGVSDQPMTVRYFYYIILYIGCCRCSSSLLVTSCIAPCVYDGISRCRVPIGGRGAFFRAPKGPKRASEVLERARRVLSRSPSIDTRLRIYHHHHHHHPLNRCF